MLSAGGIMIWIHRIVVVLEDYRQVMMNGEVKILISLSARGGLPVGRLLELVCV